MSFGKRTLIVVPETDLEYSSREAERIVNILGANLLSGKVTLDRLIDTIRTFKPQVLIISTHGSQEGILLSDGHIGADLLKPILSTVPIELVYLNTCESYDTANAIYNELPTAFISSIRPVQDRTAYVTMTTFAHHLANGMSYVDAWRKSRAAGDNSFNFWPSSGLKDQSHMPNKEPEVRQTTRNGNGEIADLHEEVSRLSYIIFGNDQWNLPGMLPQITKLQRDCNQVRILLILLIVLALLLAAAAAGAIFLP